MRTRENQHVEKTPVYTRPHGHGGIVFISTVAFVFSIISLLVSGFLAYRFLDLREEFRNSPLNSTGVLPNSGTNNSGNPAPNPAPDSGITSNSGATTNGQPTQAAIGGRAQVELLSVSRVQDPATKQRDLVRVQFRVNRVASSPVDLEYSEGLIYSEQTTARNSTTGESYKAVNPNKTTNTVSVKDIAPGDSTEAVVTLKVPENVSAIDISIPKVETFQNVPIAN
jgi:hypothetical protein